jgi:acyl transferase domain-containing protein
VLANRISYFLDLNGPSLVIDTACSASLVALHMAVRSLRSGECAAALVGGVNLIADPGLSLAYHRAGMLSPRGRCASFDASADGYVRAEGAIMVLLKPLEEALAADDPVLAVIRGSAVNHGGLAGGLTVPNPAKQSALIQAAWRDAGIDPRTVSYIEAHGTGTRLAIRSKCRESTLRSERQAPSEAGRARSVRSRAIWDTWSPRRAWPGC